MIKLYEWPKNLATLKELEPYSMNCIERKANPKEYVHLEGKWEGGDSSYMSN